MTQSELIQSIYTSFKDVKLEDGIGLYEADCLDDYMLPSDPVYISWKQKDERESWEKILPLFLSDTSHQRVYSSNYFFMDGKGKRFHLPCYLLQDLHEKYQGDNPLVGCIRFSKNLSDYDIFSAGQKQTIINFLEFKLLQFIKDENDFDFGVYTEAKELFSKYITNNK